MFSPCNISYSAHNIIALCWIGVEEVENNNNQIIEEYGDLRVSDEVVAIIAKEAASQVKGVNGMSGGFAGGIAEILGRKHLSKGVKVEVGEKQAAIDLYVIIDYGINITKTVCNSI